MKKVYNLIDLTHQHYSNLNQSTKLLASRKFKHKQVGL